MSQSIGDLAARLGRGRGGPFRPADYWRRRYADFRPTIRAVGNSTLTDAQNEEDYGRRWAEVSSALGSVIPDPHGRRLLDAGCGIGLFSRRYEQAGYAVTGVDLAAEAAAAAAEACEGEFMAGDLSEIRLDKTFSVVACHGVLVCIVEEGGWDAVLRNLIDHLEPGGVMMVQDPVRADTDTDHANGQPAHVRFRTVAELTRALEGHGLEIVVERSFRLPNEPSPQVVLVARRPG